MMSMFSLDGKVALVLGGTGILGGAIARGLAEAGAQVAITGRTLEKSRARATELDVAAGYAADVMRDEELDAVANSLAADFGRLDILVNSAGGNIPEATVMPDDSFFDVPEDAFKRVADLNFFRGTVRPCQIFGRMMRDSAGAGSVINISSMAASQPLTRVGGYDAAKAAVDNFTRWLAVQLAHECGAGLRVNAIAPGFFLTEQNRFLLTDEATGELTARGQTIVEHTPMRRFGEPEELVGAAVWLASDAARFVTGTVVAVDGGFSAFSGV